MMCPVLKQHVKLACVQFSSTADKIFNVSEARAGVIEAANAGARIVVLPECFNAPYDMALFPQYAEILTPSPPSKDQSSTYHALSTLAKDTNVYLIGGSIPEFEPLTGKYYNTTLAFGPDGAGLGSHRKTHLFDIDIENKMTFRESDVLSPGDKLTIVELPDYGTVGLGICYDVRFPEPAMIAARLGVFALIYPSAFNSTTGALHWEVLARSRALDNQVYVALCSQALPPTGYPAWGHSIITDPNGQVMVMANREKAIVYAELDSEAIGQHRRQIPTSNQRRFDLYPDISQLCTKGLGLD
ncbi:unnamed protein product [Clonostachys byssicola]|uniref:CN hydrolase domain-containing protein n=1 Tax=Clonostachys byssicola TaxID=160290 RepID=A0A9N9XXR3_9HYPO|nr:unnamed protein product [Clonostachys byssicola]